MRSTHKPFQSDPSHVLHFMNTSETRWRIQMLRAVTELAAPPASGGGEPPDDPPPVCVALPSDPSDGDAASIVSELTFAASALDCMATLAEHVRGQRYGEGWQQAGATGIEPELEDAMLGAVCALGRYVEGAVDEVLKAMPRAADSAAVA